VYQISGKLDNAFEFYDNFCCLTKRRKTKIMTRKKSEETQPIFEGLYLKNSWQVLVEVRNVK